MKNNKLLIVALSGLILSIIMVVQFLVEPQNSEHDIKNEGIVNEKNVSDKPVYKNTEIDTEYLNGTHSERNESVCNTIKFTNLKDSNDSKNNYEKIDEIQRKAQRYTCEYVGYKILDEKQLSDLLKVVDDPDNPYPNIIINLFDQMKAIGEIDEDFLRMDYTEIKKIAEESKTYDEIIDRINARQPYCDSIQNSYNFTSYIYKLNGLKDDESEQLTITDGQISYIKFKENNGDIKIIIQEEIVPNSKK